MTSTKSNAAIARPARRKFIIGSAAAGGGLAVGFPLPFAAGTAISADAGGEVGAWD